MKAPDEDTLRAIVTLEGNGSWNEIKKWIRESLTESFANSPDMRTGMAYQLVDMLDQIEGARANLENLLRRA